MEDVIPSPPPTPDDEPAADDAKEVAIPDNEEEDAEEDDEDDPDEEDEEDELDMFSPKDAVAASLRSLVRTFLACRVLFSFPSLSSYESLI